MKYVYLKEITPAVLFALLFVAYNISGAWSFQCYECDEIGGKSCTNAHNITCKTNETACWSGFGIMKNSTQELYNRVAGCTQTIGSLAACGQKICEKLREQSALTNTTMPTCQLTCCVGEKCNNPSSIPTAEPSAEPSVEPEAETTARPGNSSAIALQPVYPLFLLVVTAVPFSL